MVYTEQGQSCGPKLVWKPHLLFQSSPRSEIKLRALQRNSGKILINRRAINKALRLPP